MIVSFAIEVEGTSIRSSELLGGFLAMGRGRATGRPQAREISLWNRGVESCSERSGVEMSGGR